jgi:hypothetical protein
MVVLLRKAELKVYYAGRGRWVADPGVALSFHSIEDALLLNRQDHLQGTEIVIQHSAPGLKVVLPIGVQQWNKQQWSFC